jgi:phospholipid transport system substrate-binding protein
MDSKRSSINNSQGIVMPIASFFQLRRALLLIPLAVLLAILLAAASPARAASEGTAGRFIAALGQQVIAVMARPETGRAERLRQIRRLFAEAADLDLIGRAVLGRHWRRASAAQRAQYLTLFRTYVAGIYAAQFGRYEGERFEIVAQRDLSPREATVRARLVGGGRPPIALSFRLRHYASGFRIVDVSVQRMSLILTKRSEFDAVVRREGIGGLLRRLGATNQGV